VASPSEQSQIHGAIAADIGYRNAQMITQAAGSAAVPVSFPTEVTPAQKATLARIPSAAGAPDTFISFRTTISVTSMTRQGQNVVVAFTEMTYMRRPKPLPVYGYAIPQEATLKKVGGVWLVDSIRFARGSGMDGATCAANRWAGAC
jgi:hypothetical protein